MAPEASAGSLEVEATLAGARLRFEKSASRVRVVAWALMGLVSLLMNTVPGEEKRSMVPALYFAIAAAIALGIAAQVRRVAESDALTIGVVVFDMVTATSLGFVMRFVLVGVAEDQVTAMFARYALPAAVPTIMMLNTLRSHRGAAIAAAVSGLVLFALACAFQIGAFERPQIIAGAILALCGGLGLLVVSENKRRLHEYARTKLLEHYVSAPAKERVTGDDTSGAIDVGGKLVTVTLVATDLRGFTAMGEKTPPHEFVAQLNAYHAAMHDVIDQHDGTLDKFIGDGALIVFGLFPEFPDAGAAAALACARGMLVALEEVNRGRAAAGLAPLAMGIGIHTGAVVAGNIGVPGGRLEYTVIGDAVNIASRIEGLTKDLATPVLLSGETASRLAPAQKGALRDVGDQTVRGRVEALRLFALS